MIGLTSLRILILCEPFLCLARPQYFCCLPCPLTNDCENPYYPETPAQSGNGNAGRRGCDGSFQPQMPMPPLPNPPRLKDPRAQYQYNGQGNPPDQNCINLTIKCNGETEAYQDPYNKGAQWLRGDLPDGNWCWVLWCNGEKRPSPYQSTSAPPTPPPQMPPSPPPTQDRPNPEDPNDPCNSPPSHPYTDPRKKPNFFTNLFSIPGQLADSMLGGSIQLF